ncbi:unnamed protein product, partial [Rotaria sordida]
AKYDSNRQQKEHFNNNNRYYDTTLIPTKFTIDLTGLNISYTIEYHDNIKCICSTPIIPYTNTYINCCKCLSPNNWPSFSMINSFNEYTNQLYYINMHNNSWIQQPQQTSSTFNYHDFYLTRLNNHNNISSIHFNDNVIINAMDHLPSYYLRSIQPPPTRSWLRLASPNTKQSTPIFTVMNYNILCDKYATRHIYGYCPSWALKWEYRRKQ